MATTGDKGCKVQLKTPKGTRDWVGQDLILREKIFKTISDIFKQHGGTPLDTPVFERREILTGKYGEDARLIYDLDDQGGELCSLRFDLTVPFARWLAMRNVTHIKRYQIAKVYRRDQPAIARGRLREFYQCDFDIAGTYDPMIPDAEILCVVVEVFDALRLDVTVKLNHRRILDGVFAVAGVPSERIRTISSAVDKLDKMSWGDVKKEMVDEKGLPEEVADRIGEYVSRSGSIREVLRLLRSDAALSANDSIQAGLHDLELLASYLEAMGVDSKVLFDLSLARGLDYYSGLIYEVINDPIACKDENATNQSAAVKGKPPQSAQQKSKDQSIQVGSIAAGGRYDNLVGMYGKSPIPCVGVSFGVDRIFTILDSRSEKKKAQSAVAREVDVYVMAMGGGKDFDGLLLERMAVARELWKAGIRADFSAKVKPKPFQQLNAAKDVPLAVILGQDELAAGQVRLKVLGGSGADPISARTKGDIKSGQDEIQVRPKVQNGDSGGSAENSLAAEEKEGKDLGQLVSRENLVAEVKKLLM